MLISTDVAFQLPHVGFAFKVLWISLRTFSLIFVAGILCKFIGRAIDCWNPVTVYRGACCEEATMGERAGYWEVVFVSRPH